jgi:hypothetical protein
MTRTLCDEFGLPPSLFTMFQYNIMISLPGLKDYYLKANNREKGSKDLDEKFSLEKKNTHSSSGKSKFLENFKDKFALMRQQTGKSDRSGRFF